MQLLFSAVVPMLLLLLQVGSIAYAAAHAMFHALLLLADSSQQREEHNIVRLVHV
jgi:hypothetical protein